jgi:hypothetical protein
VSGAALRAAITPAGRGRLARRREEAEGALPAHAAMRWAQRLKRVFAIEIESCWRCGGRLEVIASIEEPALIGLPAAATEVLATGVGSRTCRRNSRCRFPWTA